MGSVRLRGFEKVYKGTVMSMSMSMGVKILTGDCMKTLKELGDGSIHMCVTSPPYYGLRDYGTATWEGGDEDCEHIGKDARTVSGGAGKQYTNKGSNRVYSGHCECGAVRVDSQIGLEETPEEYVQKMVEVFREVKRVLRDDGTLWLNIGDSYAGSGKGGQSAEKRSKGWQPEYGNKGSTYGLKPKDLIGIPWRVALALQADGWYLRQDIIWHKPNPMPESVRDRCTKAHEYIFMLAKSKQYYYDQDAIREPHSQAIKDGIDPMAFSETSMEQTEREGRPGFRDSIGVANRPHGYYGNPKGRNKRDVWTVTTKPYKEAHFATFPPDLIEPCILAGSPVGGTVLDPFGGSGTTACVALEHGRNVVLCELNPEYVALAEKRIEKYKKSVGIADERLEWL